MNTKLKITILGSLPQRGKAWGGGHLYVDLCQIPGEKKGFLVV